MQKQAYFKPVFVYGEYKYLIFYIKYGIIINDQWWSLTGGENRCRFLKL